MLIFLVLVVIVVVTLAGGVGLALAFARLDGAVSATYSAIENRDRGYNLALTLGHRIKVSADPSEQLKEARKLAAMKAAAMPRGANMGIGRLGQAQLKTASEGLAEDPQSAVKIAAFHGWGGARTGAVTAAPVAAAAVAAPVAAEAAELVPGKDYPVIEITDAMSPAEKRAARIANAKAKSAAAKSRKEAALEAPAPTAPPAAAAPAAAPVATMAGLPEPPLLIEITDEMSPDEVRKARIANSKAKAAYNKAVKAAGLDPAALAAAPEPVAAPSSAVATSQTAASVAAAAPQPAGIPEPDYIEITDDMSPDDVRKARIQNAKARSAYNKALKAAGIDPSGS